MEIGFIGLGKLGLMCAEVMAREHIVRGFDIADVDAEYVQVMNSMEDAVRGTDVIFIAVPTPHERQFDGSEPIAGLPPTDFDYSTVKHILEALNDYATPDQLVVLISTVLPGTTREQFIPLVKNYRFIYNPYLIAMGSVSWDMVNPEMVIIGTEDGSMTGDAQILIDLYKPLMMNDPRYVVGTWDEAESIKIFYNTFISMKIGMVNMIQDVAEKNGNIDVDVVTNALKDSTFRITGSKYMTAGMGDAGPCHPRDNIALRFLADRLDLKYDLFQSIMTARDVQAKNLAELLAKLSDEHDLPIFIHGESYKPNVPYVDGSYSLLIAYYLKRYSVTFIDPLTRPDALPKSVKGIILLAHDAQITYDYTNMVLDRVNYCDFEEGSVIVDPWRKYAKENPTSTLKIISYGNTRNRT